MELLLTQYFLPVIFPILIVPAPLAQVSGIVSSAIVIVEIKQTEQVNSNVFRICYPFTIKKIAMVFSDWKLNPIQQKIVRNIYLHVCKLIQTPSSQYWKDFFTPIFIGNC